MRISYRLLLAAALQIALTGSTWAAQEEKPVDEAKKARRIVRVISTQDGSPRVQVDDDARIVIVGRGEAATPRILTGFHHRGGYLGIRMVDLTPELRIHFGVPEDTGVMISAVAAGSPAADAELQVGDIVTAIDGDGVSSAFEISRKISAHEDQSIATLEIWRDDTVRAVSATIVERERPAIDIGRIAVPSSGRIHERIWLGADRTPEHILEIDQTGLQEALREFEVRVDDPEFIERFKMLGHDRLAIEKRIEELEERLKNLERELDALPKQ